MKSKFPRIRETPKYVIFNETKRKQNGQTKSLSEIYYNKIKIEHVKHKNERKMQWTMKVIKKILPLFGVRLIRK